MHYVGGVRSWDRPVLESYYDDCERIVPTVFSELVYYFVQSRVSVVRGLYRGGLLGSPRLIYDVFSSMWVSYLGVSQSGDVVCCSFNGSVQYTSANSYHGVDSIRVVHRRIMDLLSGAMGFSYREVRVDGRRNCRQFDIRGHRSVVLSLLVLYSFLCHSYNWYVFMYVRLMRGDRRAKTRWRLAFEDSFLGVLGNIVSGDYEG